MNTILVINGSPKGKNSITLHTCLFLEKKFPGYKFDYLDAGQRIKVLEKDFSPALEAIREADLLDDVPCGRNDEQSQTEAQTGRQDE